MVVLRLFAVASIVAATASSPALAAPQVEAPWTRPAAEGGTAAGFMTLRNPDETGDALVAVASPLAKTAQMHQSSLSGGMASMKQLDRLALPPGAVVTFAPGGYHLMFVGLKAPLKTGDSLPATLTFASGAKVKVSFVVSVGPPAAGHQHH